MGDLPTIGAEWATHYRLPDPGNMMERHENREAVFINQGTSITDAILNCFKKYSAGKSIKDVHVLDFGCGVGRVVLPMYHNFRKPDRCVDVDPAVIEYLKEVAPGASPEVTGFEPPLQYTSGEFDLIYSVSVWTHLTAVSAHKWLMEIRRILKPGGLALLTTSNYEVLKMRRVHPVLGPMGWADVSDDDLRTQGFIFKMTPSTPGTGTYGMASHDPDWLKQEWSKYMPVIGIESGAILGVQDINVLRKE
jgi:SAM-dependent methyltransferase